MNRTGFGYVGTVLLVLLTMHGSMAGEKPAAYEVTIDNFSFHPDSLVVPMGAKVMWINRDDVPHTVVSTDKQTIVSPALDTDEKFSHTFTTAGTNDYFCSVHPHMKGRVIVQQGSGSSVFEKEAR
jgi:plastocyanin